MSQLMRRETLFKFKILRDVFAIALLLTGAVTIVAISVSNPVAAQSYDLTTIPELPTFDEHKEGEKPFDQLSKTYQKEPYNDPSLAFQVNIPKGWIDITARELGDKGWPEEAMLSSRIFTTISEFRDGAITYDQSFFEVKAIELEHQITAKNWFFNYMLLTGYTIQAMTVLSDTSAEALYVYVRDDMSYITRAKVFMSGTRIILVTYTMSDRRWKNERQRQQDVLSSFRLLNPEPVKMDLLDTHQYFDIVRFDYPENWRLATPNVYGLDGMDVRIFQTNDDGNVNGEMFVSIISTELEISLKDEIKKIRDDLAERKIRIGSLVGTIDDYEFHPHIYFNKVEVYDALYRNADTITHEFWLAILIEENFVYIVTMITPNRKTELYTWARNAEAFEAVVQSFRI